MNSIYDKWQRFSRPALTPTTLCLGRLLFFSSFIYFFWHRSDDLAVWMEMPGTVWRPISYFKLLPQLHLSAPWVTILLKTWRIGLVFSLVGLWTRVSLPITFFLSLLVVGYPFNFGKIDHISHLPMLVMG